MSTCPKRSFFSWTWKFRACFRGLWAFRWNRRWHLEQRINTDGAFRIFCHANRFKSQVHCVKNVVQHARIIHMPCLYFCAGTRKREGDREKTGYDLKGSWKYCLPGMWFSVYMPGMRFPVYMPGMRFSDYMPGMWFEFTCPACNSNFTCPACNLNFTCRACNLNFTCPAYNWNFTCPACNWNFTDAACNFWLQGMHPNFTCPGYDFFLTWRTKRIFLCPELSNVSRLRNSSVLLVFLLHVACRENYHAYITILTNALYKFSF